MMKAPVLITEILSFKKNQMVILIALNQMEKTLMRIMTTLVIIKLKKLMRMTYLQWTIITNHIFLVIIMNYKTNKKTSQTMKIMMRIMKKVIKKMSKMKTKIVNTFWKRRNSMIKTLL